MEFVPRTLRPRLIIDEDGDGVEDNNHVTQDQLDKFRHPVFGEEMDDVENTRNGELPGHHRYGDHPEPGTIPIPAHLLKEANAKKKKAAKAETTRIS